MNRAISNNDDIIDSRDVIARIEELQGERDGHETDCPICQTSGHHPDEEECAECDGVGHVSGTTASITAWQDEYPDDAAELAALEAFAAEGESLADWRHGETLIRDDYFRTYAEELAEDIGAIDREAAWPLCHIDWDAAAESLQQDYTSLDWDGVTYWGRS